MKKIKSIPVKRLNGVIMIERMASAFPETEIKNHMFTILTLSQSYEKHNWPKGMTFLAFIGETKDGLKVINVETNQKASLDAKAYKHPNKVGETFEYKGRRFQSLGTVNGIPRYAEVLGSNSHKTHRQRAPRTLELHTTK